MSVPLKPDTRYSPILTITRWTLRIARWLTLQWYLHWLYPDLRDRGDIPEAEALDENATKRRASAVDTYVLAWVVAEVAVLQTLALQPPQGIVVFAQVLAASRFVDMLRATLNTTMMDRVAGRRDDRIASHARLVLLSVINYAELILCFSIVYASHLRLLSSRAPFGVLDVVYFSAMTHLTISFGDPTPTVYLRPVAALQGLCGLLFIALVVARMVGALKSFKEIGEP